MIKIDTILEFTAEELIEADNNINKKIDEHNRFVEELTNKKKSMKYQRKSY